MRTRTWIAMLTVLGTACACGPIAPAGPSDGVPAISVTGIASVLAVPDKIIVRFGIETDDKDLTVAKRDNSRVVEGVLAAAKELGVQDDDIQTASLTVRPEWRGWKDDENFIGHFVRNAITITLADVDTVEPMLNAALNAGVNYVHGVSYETTEFERYSSEAREAALLAAREQAESMAAVLGRSIGEPIVISGSFSGYANPHSSGQFGGGHQGGGFGGGAMQETPETTLVLGKITIRATASVEFELVD